MKAVTQQFLNWLKLYLKKASAETSKLLLEALLNNSNIGTALYEKLKLVHARISTVQAKAITVVADAMLSLKSVAAKLLDYALTASSDFLEAIVKLFDIDKIRAAAGRTAERAVKWCASRAAADVAEHCSQQKKTLYTKSGVECGAKDTTEHGMTTLKAFAYRTLSFFR